MRSTLGSSLADARSLFASARRRIRGYTPAGTYAEACAFVVGYDSATGGELLDGFQAWLGDRHDGRSELAFWILVLREVFPGRQVSAGDLGEDEHAAAVDRLFELLDEYLAGWSPA